MHLIQTLGGLARIVHPFGSHCMDFTDTHLTALAAPTGLSLPTMTRSQVLLTRMDDHEGIVGIEVPHS